MLPLSEPAIQDGAVLIHGDQIEKVGRWQDLSSTQGAGLTDLGDLILLPGLVNAHCHLDYTHMAGQLAPPKVFSDWLKLITSTKAGWSVADYTESWLSGAEMLLRSGTTTAADIEAVPELLPKVCKATPLRVFSFLEMIGITSRRRPRTVLGVTLAKLRSLGAAGVWAGLAPHAPYSTLSELLRLSGAAARRRKLGVVMHVAESALEFEMFTRAKGEMFDWLQRSGRDMSDCGLGSPVQHLERCGLLSGRLLAVHVNYLGPKDAALLGRRKVNVVHCPRSHFYFRHDPFPLRRLARAGVNLCIGTDSLATVYKTRHQKVELDLFEEMRALAQEEPWLSPRAILRMATVNGASALGMKGRIGELSRGAFADVIAVPFACRPAGIHEAVLQHKGRVAASMIGGRWIIGPAEAGIPNGEDS